MNVIDYCYNDDLKTYVFVIKNKDTNEPIVKRYDTKFKEKLESLVAIWNVHTVNELKNNALK